MNHKLFDLFVEYGSKAILFEKIENLIKQEIEDAVGKCKVEEYQFLCKLSNSINNTGWQDRHSSQIDMINKEMYNISENYENYLP